MTEKGKVLVTNGGRRKAGPIICSLGRAGVGVHIIDAGSMPATRFSRYCTRFDRCPDPALHPAEFTDWLLLRLQTEHYDAVFPLDEDVIEAVLARREEFEQHTRIPLPRTDAYLLARDKSRTADAAKAAGVLMPQTWTPCCAAEAEELAHRITYPVLIKPRASSGSRGITRVERATELEPAWRTVNARYPLPIVQALVPPGGEALGVSMLFNAKGEPRATFTHRRLREYPRSGGPSTLREAVSVPKLEAQTCRLLQSLSWFGVAMVEYKTDPRTGTPFLLEINPRFWGSIALAIHAGVDFPALLYRMLMEGDIESVSSYTVGARCRWLIGDCLHFLSAKPHLQQAMALMRSFDGSAACDEIQGDDLLMGLGYLISGAYQFASEPKFRELLRGRR